VFIGDTYHVCHLGPLVARRPTGGSASDRSSRAIWIGVSVARLVTRSGGCGLPTDSYRSVGSTEPPLPGDSKPASTTRSARGAHGPLLSSPVNRPPGWGHVDGLCDGESACKRDPVTALAGGRWPSICAVYPKVASPPGLGTAQIWDRRGGRAARAFCLTLLPVGFAEPPGSPRALVRSYRTVSPLPDPGCPGHRRSALCCTAPSGRPDLALASTVPFGVPTFLDTVDRAAATRPTHRQPPLYRRRKGANVTEASYWHPLVSRNARSVRDHAGQVAPS
jgi:hypothetical protein